MTSFEEQLANPIRIEAGQIVCEPGVYDIPIDWYHDDCCDGPSVSSTSIKQFLHCPIKFWQQSYLNPDRLPEIKEKETSYFDFGKAAHTLFLGDEEFHAHFVVREFEDASWKDWRKQAAKDWREEMHDKGYGVLTADDMERLRRVANVCRDAYEIRELGILEGYVERSLIFQDALTGIWVKYRPDILPPLERTVVDLKTTGQDADARSLERSMGNLGYYIQLGLGAWALRKLSDIAFNKFLLLTIENSDFPAYSLNEVDPEDIGRGEALSKMAIEKMGQCFASGQWSTYPSNTRTLHLSSFQRERIDADLIEHEAQRFKEAAE